MAQKFLNGIDVSSTTVVNGSNLNSGSTVLDVQGSQGQLFSVTNSLTGDLFSVSDISGIPILNVNSSGAVNVDGTLTVGGSITTVGGNIIAGGAVYPASNASASLGLSNKQWAGLDLSSSSAITWGNGDAEIIEGETNNYSLTFKTYDGTNNSAALRLDGDNTATFTGNVKLPPNKYILIGTDSGDAFNTASAIRVQDTSHAYVQMKVGDSSQGGFLIGNTSDDYLGGFTYSNSSESLIFKTANTDALTITGAGNATFAGSISATSGSFTEETHIADVVDGPFTALRLMNQKTYGSGTGVNETVRFVMGISENGYAYSSREGFAIEFGIGSESDSSDGVVDFKVRDGGTLGTYQTVNGSDKSVTFAGNVTIKHASSPSLTLTDDSPDPDNIGKIDVANSYMTFSLDSAAGIASSRMRFQIDGSNIVEFLPNTTYFRQTNIHFQSVSAPQFNFRRDAAITAGDDIGKINFGSTNDEGTSYTNGGNIIVEGDGTWDLSDSSVLNGPTRMKIQLRNSSGALQNAMMLSSNLNANFYGDLTVAGNLVINGTTTTLKTQTVEVEDNILQLNTTQGTPDTATAATSGISIYRGVDASDVPITQASLIFDDGDDTWDLTNNLTVAGDVVGASFAVPSGASTGFLKADGSVDSTTFATSTHNHDDRYYTETEISENTAQFLGWVPAYGSGLGVSWNVGEGALEIQNPTDTSTGASYKAQRVTTGQTIRVTLMAKASTAAGAGLYLRLYQHNGDLPDGKTHVSNNASSSAVVVQEDDAGVTSWVENAAVTTDWVTYEKEYTVLANGYISVVVLNWTGIGTNSLYITNPDIQTVRASNSDKLDAQEGTYYLNYNNFGTAPTWNQNTTGNAATATTATNSTQLNGFTLDRIDHAQAFHTFDNIDADSTQAKRYHIGRLYGCPAHWDGNWQNIEFNVTAESYESGHLRYMLMGDYGGSGSQAGMMDLYLKEASGPMVGRFRFVLGTPVDAGWDHSGQDTFYVDLYAEAAHYSQWKINIKTYGHGTQNTNPTSGGATTVFYDSPTASNVTTFNESHSTIYHLGDEIYHEGHLPTLSELGAAPDTVVNQSDFVSAASGGTFSGNLAINADVTINGSTDENGAVTPRILDFTTNPTNAGLAGSGGYQIGEIAFTGKDSSTNAAGKYARIRGSIVDSNTTVQGSGGEGGKIQFTLLKHDAGAQPRVEYDILTLDPLVAEVDGQLDVTGNIHLTGGGTIEATSTSGAENLILKAAGGVDVIIDSNGNGGDNEIFRVMHHTSAVLFEVQEGGEVRFQDGIRISGTEDRISSVGGSMYIGGGGFGNSLVQFSAKPIPDSSYSFDFGASNRYWNQCYLGTIHLKSALLSNQENTDIDSAAAEMVAQVAIATYTAAFFDFVVKKGTNVRSGTVYACHDGTNVEFTETSTNDLGNTSDVTLSVDISGGNMRLLATVTSDDWSVKSLIRAI